jgi:hypothetical protein
VLGCFVAAVARSAGGWALALLVFDAVAERAVLVDSRVRLAVVIALAVASALVRRLADGAEAAVRSRRHQHGCGQSASR